MASTKLELTNLFALTESRSVRPIRHMGKRRLLDVCFAAKVGSWMNGIK
jgi:hypothetical protein